MTAEDFHPHPTADTPPVGQQIVIPPVALSALLDLHTASLNDIAAILDTSVGYLRRFTPAPIDRCLNRGTCTMDNQQDRMCMLCAIDAATVRRLPTDARTDQAITLFNAGPVAKQLATDTIDANPHHGGEVFVLSHLADLIRSGALEAARAAYDDANTNDEATAQGSDA